METNLLIQYIAVFLILVIIIVWILYRLFHPRARNKQGSCRGCSLSEACNKKDLIQKYKEGSKSCDDYTG